MNDAMTADKPPRDPSDAWLAAYALGLVYSDKSEQQRLAELLEMTWGRPELLAAAYKRLDGAGVVERALGDEALLLLERAQHAVGDEGGEGWV